MVRPFPWSWGSPGAPTGLDVLMLCQIVKAAVILGWFVLEVSLCTWAGPGVQFAASRVLSVCCVSD